VSPARRELPLIVARLRDICSAGIPVVCSSDDGIGPMAAVSGECG
jgi:hypothetical protein